jgi:hypothetical protein
MNENRLHTQHRKGNPSSRHNSRRRSPQHG